MVSDKTCPRCGDHKPIDSFSLLKNGRRHSYCRECQRGLARQWREAHPEKVAQQNERESARRAADGAYRERRYATTARWRDANRQYIANNNLKAMYNITLDDYFDLLNKQGGGCAACGSTESEQPRSDERLHVDHDHSCCPGRRSCGKCVRGLLCHWCNVTLGLVRDDPARLRRLAEYLEAAAGFVERTA